MKWVILLLVVLCCGCVGESGPESAGVSSSQATSAVSSTSSTTSTTSSTLAPVVVFMVRIRDMAAHPKDVTITRNNAVSWLNDDPIAHEITFDTFSSGKIGPGEMYTHVFNESGTYYYYCSIHKRYMQGTVTVT